MEPMKTLQWTTIHHDDIFFSFKELKKYAPRGCRGWDASDYLDAHMAKGLNESFDLSGEIIYGCASEEEAIQWATKQGLTTCLYTGIDGSLQGEVYWAETYLITDERDEMEAGDMCPGDTLEELGRPWVAPLESDPYEDEDDEDEEDDEDCDDDEYEAMPVPVEPAVTEHSIGAFSVSSGALVVLDPLCDSEGAIRIDAAHNGEWAVKVIRNTMYGVTNISAACIGAEPGIYGSKSAMLDVDAGMAAIIDAEACQDELGPEDGRVDKFLALTGGAVGASIMARGAVTRSGQGDGKYPVYIYRNAKGLAYRVEALF